MSRNRIFIWSAAFCALILFTSHSLSNISGGNKNKAYASALRSNAMFINVDTVILVEDPNSKSLLPAKQLCTLSDDSISTLGDIYNLSTSNIEIDDSEFIVLEGTENSIKLKDLEDDFGITPFHCVPLSIYELLILSAPAHLS